MKRKNEETDYCCPICDAQLQRIFGNQMFPNNPAYGVTLFCMNGDPSGKAHPQEVSGHSKTEKDAYNIILAKFTNAKVELTTTPED